MLPDNDDTDVGYGRPPKRNRFRKGQSGNPKGRPKGKLNLATLLERAQLELVIVNENGTRRKVTKIEAACKQLANKAASGDLIALKLLNTLTCAVEDLDAPDPKLSPQSSEADRKAFQNLLLRMNSTQKEK